METTNSYVLVIVETAEEADRFNELSERATSRMTRYKAFKVGHAFCGERYEGKRPSAALIMTPHLYDSDERCDWVVQCLRPALAIGGYFLEYEDTLELLIALRDMDGKEAHCD